MGVRPISLALGLCVTLSALTCGIALACSCAFPTPEEEFANASAVFTADVTSITESETGQRYVVTFHWLACWKGEIEGEVVATTSKSTASCGYPFALGGRYLIYAHGGSPSYTVSLCSRTNLLREGLIEEEGLGDPKQVGVSTWPWSSVKKLFRD